MSRSWRHRAGMAWLVTPPVLRMAIFLCAAMVIATCAGCNATMPVLPARTAIPVECKEPIPDRPAMPTANLTSASTLDASVQAMQAEIALRDGYEGSLVTALTACTKPVKP